MTAFDIFKQYLTVRYNRQIVYIARRDMRRYCNAQCKANRMSFNENTFDTYRRYATKAGYLRHTGRGVYYIVKLIDCNLQELIEQAYPDYYEARKLEVPCRRISSEMEIVKP